MNWQAELRRMEAAITGPEDEPDPSVNGDIDSLEGEEDDETSGGNFEEMNDWPDEDEDEEDGEEEDE